MMHKYLTLLLVIGLVFWGCEDIIDQYKIKDYILYKNLIIGQDGLYYKATNGKTYLYSGMVHKDLDFSTKYMGNIINGKKQGSWKYWQKNGGISFSHKYRNGEVFGIYCYY